MWWRLGNDRYASAEDLLADLRVIRASLAANGGRRIADGRIAALERMVEVFGFHVAKLDVRLHARDLDGERARDALAAAAEAQARHGSAAIDTLIISGTSSIDDIRKARALTELNWHHSSRRSTTSSPHPESSTRCSPSGRAQPPR